MNQPPSFEPRKRVQRPSVEGAHEVGRPSHAARPRARSARRAAADPDQGVQPRSSADSQPRSSTGARRPSAPVRRSAFDNRAPERPYAEQAAAPAAAPGAAAPVNATVNTAPPAYAPHRPVPGHDEDRYGAPAGQPGEPPAARARRRHPGRILAGALAIIVLLVLGWGYYLYSYGNGKLGHEAALSSAPDTAGETFLIVGSDERGEAVNDPTEGHRADTIMLLHKSETGPAALVSLPRDTLVHFPDSKASGKLNGSFSFGGAEYLVHTVEELTGLKIDHYIQIGMDGVKNLTDAVGGVELCLDYDVSDEYSGLQWTAGCHHSDGTTALAFSRMRYSDPLGDIGRTERQRQVVSKIIDKALSPSLLVNPLKQRSLVGSVAEVLSVDTDGSIMTVAKAGLALRDAIGPDGLKGAPPIASLNHRGPGGASTVLLAPEADQFWLDLRDGKLTKDSFASF